MWFFFAVAGYFLLALVLVLDKLILTKSVAKPVVYTFYSTIFLLLGFLAWPLGAVVPAGIDLFLSLLSGLTFLLGMWTLFIAVKRAEASHINPFVGAVITVATYTLSTFFLHETLTRVQIAGVMILSFGSFLLSSEKSKNHNGFHSGFLWGILSGILFAVSLVAAKDIYTHYSFITGLLWTRASAGIFGILLLLSPSVRHAMRNAFKKRVLKSYGRRHARGIIIANKVLSVVGIILAHYAIAKGSVTLVNALAGLEYVFMFIMIFFCTKFFPRIFKEYFTRHELSVELAAIALVAFGSVLFVI